ADRRDQIDVYPSVAEFANHTRLRACGYRGHDLVPDLVMVDADGRTDRYAHASRMLEPASESAHDATRDPPPSGVCHREQALPSRRGDDRDAVGGEDRERRIRHRRRHRVGPWETTAAPRVPGRPLRGADDGDDRPVNLF